MNFLSVSVVLSFLVCIVFAATVIVLNVNGIDVSDTLIQMFYTVFGIEFGAAAAIKISKHKIKLIEKKEEVKAMKEEGIEVEKKDLKLSDDSYEEEDIYYG